MDILFAGLLWLNFLIACAEKMRLSTRMARGPVWPKPTKAFRKSFNITESSTAPVQNEILDVFNITELEIRRSGDNFAWGWDKWCQLQPGVGNCRQQATLFYYQTKTDTCREFSYTGCNGNENKFSTRKDCEQFCKGFGTAMEVKSLSPIESCSLQHDPGNCLAYMTRYYYDINEGRCIEFVFGGCGGNPNRFSDRDSCMKHCDKYFKNLRSKL